MVKPIMNKWVSICGALAMASAAAAWGEEFPLTFRTIPAKDVMAFPSGLGAYGQLRLAKPAKLVESPGRSPASRSTGSVAIRFPEEASCSGWMNPEARARATTSLSSI